MAFSFQTLSIFPQSASDTEFRQWGSAVSVAIAAVGLIQTSDTGQINWTTVLAPTTTNQKRGYEIWRFNDSLQATRPIYVRLDYGSGPNVQYNPQIWFTVGTATDGAGNITANASFANSLHPVKTIFTTAGVAWYGATRNPFYVSSDGAGSLLLAGWMIAVNSNNPTYAGGFLLIERTRDWDGTPNGEGALTITHAATSPGTPLSQTLFIANAGTFSQGSNWSGVPTFAGGAFPLRPTSGMVSGGVLNVYPVFTGNSPQLNGPSKHVVAVWSADMPAYSTFPLTVYGTAGTYMALGSTFIGWEMNALGLCGAFRVA